MLDAGRVFLADFFPLRSKHSRRTPAPPRPPPPPPATAHPLPPRPRIPQAALVRLSCVACDPHAKEEEAMVSMSSCASGTGHCSRERLILH
eukprot:scaffold8788_cov108-Isochrysis_galbana.AAC.10